MSFGSEPKLHGNTQAESNRGLKTWLLGLWSLEYIGKPNSAIVLDVKQYAYDPQINMFHQVQACHANMLDTGSQHLHQTPFVREADRRPSWCQWDSKRCSTEPEDFLWFLVTIFWPRKDQGKVSEQKPVLE